jgi:hypothetical protein
MCGVPHDSEQLYSHEVEEVALSLPSLLLLTTRREKPEGEERGSGEGGKKKEPGTHQ